MLRIGAEVIERMIKVQTRLGPNPDTDVRVGSILGKLFVGIVKSLGTLKTIAEIQKGKRTILQIL